MTIKGNAPEWAIELITKVCKKNNRKLPLYLDWKNANRHGSSGRFSWYRDTIWIMAGRDLGDQKHVVLHELGHHLNARSRKRRGDGHTVKFWKTAFMLYDKYGDITYAAKREASYKKFATVVYERYYKPE